MSHRRRAECTKRQRCSRRSRKSGFLLSVYHVWWGIARARPLFPHACFPHLRGKEEPDGDGPLSPALCPSGGKGEDGDERGKGAGWGSAACVPLTDAVPCPSRDRGGQ